jgi:hypothetical protein
MMPEIREAEALLEAGGRLNPGLWVEHSLNVARAARAIAAACDGLDADRAYVLGCLHDIGRRKGRTGMGHVLDGHRFMAELGFDEAARICLTHSFPYQDARAISNAAECPAAEVDEMARLLAPIAYDDYDRLIQLCDSLAMASGFVLIEKRLVDVALRYGCNPLTVPKWQAILGLKDYFDRLSGGSVYRLLPGVVENTFAPDGAGG